MSIELKIKSKHLGEEARIIRFEENRMKKRIKEIKNEAKIAELNGKISSICEHRKIDVRNENRSTFLARAYIQGKTYHYAEKSRKNTDDYTFNCLILPRTLAMIQKYGTKEMRNLTLKDLAIWAEK